ncbi:MAG: GAF domain-containing protein, partial [Proteobacteria bacterium]|nr:GAF domain-containing protein [Pseudomonadota bacterium]
MPTPDKPTDATYATYEQLEDRIKELNDENKELRILYDAATAIGSTLSLEETLESIAMNVTAALDSAGCVISLWLPDRNQIKVLIDHYESHPDGADEPGQIYNLEDSPETLKVLETGQALLIRRDDPKVDRKEIEFMKEEGIFTNLVIPMKTKDRAIGLLEIYENVRTREFSKRKIRLAEALAFRAAAALENSRLYEDARKEIVKRKKAGAILLALYNISRAVNSTKSLDELFKLIHESLAALLETTNFSISLYDEEKDEIRFPYLIDEKDGHYVIKNASGRSTLATKVIFQNRAHFFDEAMLKRMSESDRDEIVGAVPKVWLGVPLSIKGKVIGAVVVQSYTDSNLYSEKDIGLLESV